MTVDGGQAELETGRGGDGFLGLSGREGAVDKD